MDYTRLRDEPVIRVVSSLVSPAVLDPTPARNHGSCSRAKRSASANEE
jgi:hypothetical protein